MWWRGSINAHIIASNPQSTNPSCPRRPRLNYALVIVLVFTLGLPTRLIPQYLPAVCVNYVGDGLWALAIFLLLGLCFPTASTRRLAISALAITWGIEFSELYQADLINTLRSYRLGGLILGYTFLWSDLVCYTVGIGVGALLGRFLPRQL
jgi:hypothetical protein